MSISDEEIIESKIAELERRRSEVQGSKEVLTNSVVSCDKRIKAINEEIAYLKEHGLEPKSDGN